MFVDNHCVAANDEDSWDEYPDEGGVDQKYPSAHTQYFSGASYFGVWNRRG